MSQETRNLIVSSIKEKSILKQDVFNNTILNFKLLKSRLKAIAEDLEKEIGPVDNRIAIEYKEKGEYEAQLKIAVAYYWKLLML